MSWPLDERGAEDHERCSGTDWHKWARLALALYKGRRKQLPKAPFSATFPPQVRRYMWFLSDLISFLELFKTLSHFADMAGIATVSTAYR